MAELVAEYADFPLGGKDASVIALAERLDASAILTLDRRHFRRRPAPRQSVRVDPLTSAFRRAEICKGGGRLGDGGRGR